MRIRWTRLATRDFQHICDYTENNYGVGTAERLALQILGAIRGLTQFPNIGRPGYRKGTREIIFTDTPYIGIYRIREEMIEIVRIVHGAQKWQ